MGARKNGTGWKGRAERMIEILLVPERGLEPLCARLGVPARPGLLVYAAKDGAQELGWCGFIPGGDEGELFFSHAAEPSLRMLEDGLLRCALSYLYEHGARKAFCRGSVDPRLLKRLGFSQRGKRWTLDFSGSFLEQGCPGEAR